MRGEISKSRGNNNFPEIGGKNVLYMYSENRLETQNCESMTKKKGQIGKFSMESEKFSEIGEEI